MHRVVVYLNLSIPQKCNEAAANNSGMLSQYITLRENINAVPEVVKLSVVKHARNLKSREVTRNLRHPLRG